MRRTLALLLCLVPAIAGAEPGWARLQPALLDGHDRDRLRSALGDTPGPMHVVVDDDIPFQVVADTLTAITRAPDGRVVREAVLTDPF